jgi:hypothetical protein
MLFDLGQMSVKTCIGLVYQLAVKSLFAAARLVTRHQKNGLSMRVESESHTPDAISGVKPSMAPKVGSR